VLDAEFNSLIGGAPGSVTGAALAAGNPFCDLIQREYVGGPPLTPGNYGADRKYSAQFINQGGVFSEGVDVQADFSVGSFNVNVNASFLDSYAESPFPGAAFAEFAGTSQDTSYFDYQLLSTVNYIRGPMSIGLRWQHLPSVDPPPGSAASALGVDSHDQIDVFGSWTFAERYQLRAGIDNLTNADPEWVGATTVDNNVGTTNNRYDQIGRRVFIALQVAL
jgi:outer membrane receptor protein involved in Fe transport